MGRSAYPGSVDGKKWILICMFLLVINVGFKSQLFSISTHLLLCNQNSWILSSHSDCGVASPRCCLHGIFYLIQMSLRRKNSNLSIEISFSCRLCCGTDVFEDEVRNLIEREQAVGELLIRYDTERLYSPFLSNYSERVINQSPPANLRFVYKWPWWRGWEWSTYLLDGDSGTLSSNELKEDEVHAMLTYILGFIVRCLYSK